MNEYREGVVVLLEDRDGRIAMQLRDDLHQWGLFGGWLEEGETPEAAARREIDEELSARLSPAKLVRKSAYLLPEIKAVAYVFHYLVTDELDQAILKEGLAWRFMARDELTRENTVPHHLTILKQYYHW